MQFYAPRELRTPKPLRARGIKVVFSGFTELKATQEDVSEYLTDYWRAEWQKEAMLIRSDYDLQAMRAINLARVQAQRDLVNTLATILDGRKNTREALVFRVLEALEAAASDPGTRSLTPRDTIRMLARIQQMLFPGGDGGLPGGGSGLPGGGGGPPDDGGETPDDGDETPDDGDEP